MSLSTEEQNEISMSLSIIPLDAKAAVLSLDGVSPHKLGDIIEFMDDVKKKKGLDLPIIILDGQRMSLEVVSPLGEDNFVFFRFSESCTLEEVTEAKEELEKIFSKERVVIIPGSLDIEFVPSGGAKIVLLDTEKLSIGVFTAINMIKEKLGDDVGVIPVRGKCAVPEVFTTENMESHGWYPWIKYVNLLAAHIGMSERLDIFRHLISRLMDGEVVPENELEEIEINLLDFKLLQTHESNRDGNTVEFATSITKHRDLFFQVLEDFILELRGESEVGRTLPPQHWLQYFIGKLCKSAMGGAENFKIGLFE